MFATAETLDPAALALEAEHRDFDVLFFPDHTHVPLEGSTAFPGGGAIPDHYRRTYDPMIAVAFAAAATTRLRVGIGVCLVPARDPIVLAKQLASLDVLSGGRLVVGVGAGWNAAEIRNHGVDPADRWSVMGERVLAVKAIWTQDVTAFEGSHVRFTPLWSWPKPLQKPHPPIVVGGYGPGVLRRTVDYGDEWLAMVVPGQPPLRERMAKLAALAGEAGRDPIPVSVQAYGDPPPPRLVEHYISCGVARIDFGLRHGSRDEALASLESLTSLVAHYRD